jgi:hypothetical protein
MIPTAADIASTSDTAKVGVGTIIYIQIVSDDAQMPVHQ